MWFSIFFKKGLHGARAPFEIFVWYVLTYYTEHKHNGHPRIVHIRERSCTWRCLPAIGYHIVCAPIYIWVEYDYSSAPCCSCRGGTGGGGGYCGVYSWSSALLLTLISSSGSTNCVQMGHWFVWYLRTFTHLLHMHYIPKQMSKEF
jgi:hypothetical protein